jgi:hypothetical protein
MQAWIGNALGRVLGEEEIAGLGRDHVLKNSSVPKVAPPYPKKQGRFRR